MKTRMPSAKAVAEVLRGLVSRIEPEFTDEEGNNGFDVRLQVLPATGFPFVGSWSIHEGDPSYDTDHNGYWGAGFLQPDTDCDELARELIDEAADHAAQCESV